MKYSIRWGELAPVLVLLVRNIDQEKKKKKKNSFWGRSFKRTPMDV